MQSTSSSTDFLKSAISIAEHFGFRHLDALSKNPTCVNCAVTIPYTANAGERKSDALHGLLTNGACAYFDNRLNGIEGPVLFYTIDSVPRTGETALSLQVLNVSKSIAEAILIETMRAIITEAGYPHYTVRINSLGDQDSLTRYTRELTNFLKKRLDDMPPQARELMKEHAFSALEHLIEKNHDLAFRSPNPLEYLSDASRKHFREIVEYLDMSGTPYEIDAKLIGSPRCYNDALFAFNIEDGELAALGEEPLIARGGRYGNFVTRAAKAGVPAVGAVIVLKNKKIPVRIPKAQKQLSPSVFVVQLGFGPKIKSLMIMNELRGAGIAVNQDLMSDSLGTQLRQAEALGIRFAVILGQKEFVDGNVILRDLHSRSQEAVAQSGLVNYLKRVVR